MAQYLMDQDLARGRLARCRCVQMILYGMVIAGNRRDFGQQHAAEGTGQRAGEPGHGALVAERQAEAKEVPVRLPKNTCAACPLHREQQRAQRVYPPRRRA